MTLTQAAIRFIMSSNNFIPEGIAADRQALIDAIIFYYSACGIPLNEAKDAAAFIEHFGPKAEG